MLIATLLAAAASVVFTNEEQVYFDKEAGRTPPPWTAVELADGKLKSIDAFGHDAPALGEKSFRADGDTLTLTFADGSTRALRRARPVTCWGSALKAQRKPDGSEDWSFARDLKLHDQGGRVAFGGTDGSKPVVLRMRNVVWPSGPNKPSVVLYVHTPDQPDHAVSYSWADPSAERIGINLRWMQASCTIDKGGK